MTSDLRVEMNKLFSAFLPPAIASRFSSLLAMKPQHWGKIDPWRAWECLDTNTVIAWSGSIATLTQSGPLKGRGRELATVLRCGHDKPLLQRELLGEAIQGSSRALEAFVSIEPGKLGLAINHDGGICLLRK